MIVFDAGNDHRANPSKRRFLQRYIRTVKMEGFPTIEPTGKPFSLREFVFWKVKGGKIIERKVMVDMLDLIRQLGGLPNQSSS